MHQPAYLAVKVGMEVPTQMSPGRVCIPGNGVEILSTAQVQNALVHLICCYAEKKSGIVDHFVTETIHA